MPTLADFIAWVRNIALIPTNALPSNSPWFGYAYNNAIEAVNLQLACVPTAPGQNAGWSLYALAVYYYGADYLINWAPDQSGQTWFADARKAFNISAPVAGIVSSTSDQGTSSSYAVPDWARGLQFGDLQLNKTPYGRAYLAIAQNAGPTVIGLS